MGARITLEQSRQDLVEALPGAFGRNFRAGMPFSHAGTLAGWAKRIPL
jgi:hypothetical protein